MTALADDLPSFTAECDETTRRRVSGNGWVKSIRRWTLHRDRIARLRLATKSVERAMIERALQDARFNKSQAAKRLGLTRAQLYVRLHRHGLE